MKIIRMGKMPIALLISFGLVLVTLMYTNDVKQIFSKIPVIKDWINK
jgi:hypothetical protein